eukprot:scaffold130453_cov75-Phaeocystis_antarctica.AAC.2
MLGAHFGGAGRCEVDFAHCEWHSALHKGAGLDALYGQISTDAHRPFRLRHTLVPVVLDFYAFLTPQLRQLVLDEVWYTHRVHVHAHVHVHVARARRGLVYRVHIARARRGPVTAQ